MSAFCLDLHAGYRCRHSGACCRTDWSIPAETHVLHAVGAQRIRLPGVTGPLFVATARSDRGAGTREPGSDPVVARNADGTCVFYERNASGLCAIHRRAGADALPSACRHFPREILIDARGTFISLSHFCPTAAALLFAPASLDVVDAHPPLQLAPPVEGMDATSALAPLVRPGLLCDVEGYDAWERACLGVLAQPAYTAQYALDLIGTATEHVRDWRPQDGPLSVSVGRAFCRTPAVPFQPFVGFAELCAQHFPPASGPVARFDRVWDWLVQPALEDFEPVIKNYLAARLFGNWMAYQGRGLRSIVEWLRTAMAVLRNEIARRSAASGSSPVAADVVEAIRATDLLLLHTVDSEILARRFAPLEGPEPA